jgi:hypothetical protein
LPRGALGQIVVIELHAEAPYRREHARRGSLKKVSFPYERLPFVPASTMRSF